jgi:hypothetical protein
MRRDHLAATLFAAVLLILISLAVALAQGPVPTSLTLYADENSFIVYVPASNGPVSLRGLTFEVALEGETTPYSYRLEDYPGFSNLNFDAIPSPICFRLIRNGTAPVRPNPCRADEVHDYIFSSESHIFWYDSLNGIYRTIDVVVGETPISRCSMATHECSTGYIPPTSSAPTPTPDPCVAPPSSAMYPVPGAPAVEIDVAPVSNAAFQVFLGCGGCDESAQWWPSTPNGRVWRSVFPSCPVPETFSAGQEQSPRTGVPWYVADAFCRWRGARLPSENEWSWAAQGNVPGWVSGVPEWLSDGDGTTYAVIFDDAHGGPHIVGQCAPNYNCIALDAAEPNCTSAGLSIGFRCAR